MRFQPARDRGDFSELPYDLTEGFVAQKGKDGCRVFSVPDKISRLACILAKNRLKYVLESGVSYSTIQDPLRFREITTPSRLTLMSTIPLP